MGVRNIGIRQLGIQKPRQRSGISWSSYWTPSSYVVENAAPLNVVITYDKKIEAAPSLSDLWVSDHMISSLSLDATSKILTLVLTYPVIYGETLTLSINSGTEVFAYTITNNVQLDSATTTFMTNAGIVDGTTYFGTTAYEITGLGMKLAIDKFVKGLRFYSLFDKLISYHPLLGGTYNTAKLNLVNPLNTDAAHRLEEGTAPTYDALGITGNASNKYMRSHIIPSDIGAYNNFSIGCYYSGTQSSGKYLFGIIQDTDKRLTCSPNFNGTTALFDLPGFSNRLTPTKLSGGSVDFYMENGKLNWNNNGISQIGKCPMASVTMPDAEIFLLAYSNSGTATGHTAATISDFYTAVDMTFEDITILGMLRNQLFIDLKRITYTAITKTLTIDNSANKEALTDYLASINLTSSEFTFANMVSGNHLNIYDGTKKLPYWINKLDLTNSLINLYVKDTVGANSTKTLSLKTGENSNLNQLFSDVMTRKAIDSTTISLYKFDTLQDTLGVGADFSLTNSSLITSLRYGTILRCVGSNSYATIAKAFPDADHYPQHIRFNFVFGQDRYNGNAGDMVLGRYVDATHNFYCGLATDGRFRVVSYANSILAYSVKNYWAKGEVNSFDIKFIDRCIIIRVNNETLYAGVRYSGVNELIPITGNFTLGQFADGTTRTSDIAFFDFEVVKGRNSVGYEFSRNLCIPQFKDLEYRKWQFVAEVPTGLDTVMRFEPSILSVGSELWLYGADNDASAPCLSRRISTDNGVTWSAIVSCTIQGVLSKINRPFVFIDPLDNKYKVIYQRLTTQLDIAESIDGTTFTNAQKFIDLPADGEATSTENSCVYWDADISKWRGLIDCGNSIHGWSVYPIEGNTLLTMTPGSRLTSIHTAFKTTMPIIAGGCYLTKIAGVYHVWCHTNIPSVIYRFKNANWDDNWASVYGITEIFTLNSIRAGDQIGDISICIKDGVLYCAWANDINTSPINGNYEIWKYEGSYADLIGDTSIAIT